MRYRLPLIAIALVATAAVIIVLSSGTSGYQLSFLFRDAAGLRAGDEVKIDGAPAGQVESVAVTSAHLALVKVGLDRAAGPVGAGASAAMRPTGLLGEPYVDLSVGNGARPLDSGTVIPVSRTATAVSFGSVLDTLDAPTRVRLQILIAATGGALAGRGQDLHSILSVLPDSLHQARLMLDQLRARKLALADLVNRGDRILAAAATHRQDLGQLIADATGALQTVAAKRAQLAATVRDAPAALNELSNTVTTLGATAQQLAPTSDLLVAAAPPLRTVLAALPAFRSAVRQVLSTTRRVSPRIVSFGRQATGPIRKVSSVLDQLAALAATVRPLIDVLRNGGTDELFRFVDGFSQAMERQDGIGSLVRIALVPTLGPNPAARTADTRARNLRLESKRSRAASDAAGRRVASPSTTQPNPTPNSPATEPTPPPSPPPTGSPPDAGGSLSSLLQYLLGR